MTGRAARGWTAACGVLLLCAGCGFKGPLYLPERNTTVVTHPARPAQAATSATKKANTPQSPQSPSPTPPPPQ